MGRSEKAIRNVFTGVANKLIMMVLAFVTRTLFIRLLGAEYTGVNSLFSNILSVLSLAELGMGNVLMFYLYSALKDKDHEYIRHLVNRFKRIYITIAIIILSIGLALIPLLQYIVKSDIELNELIQYYVLYLINTACSYFVVYRIMVINADQKNYIVNVVQTASTIAMYVFQIIYLLICKQFLGYLIIQVLCTIASNIILNGIAIKHYPFLRKKDKTEKKYQELEKGELVKNLKATFIFKISDTILDQTDSIIISMMFGTVFVGYYYNYFLLITYIVAIAGIIANGLVASFGNLVAEGDMEKSYDMFKVALLCFAIFGAFCSAAYACLIQEFIPLWVGNQYVMNYDLVIAILLVFYLRMATNTMWMYRSAMGIFKEIQYINLISAGTNIVLSVILGKMMGLSGVIVATAISRLITSFWFEAKIVYKKFSKPVSLYFKQQTKDFCICAVITLICFYACNKIAIHGYAGLAIRLVLVTSITVLVEFAVYHNSKEYQTLKNKIINIIHR